MLFVLNSLAVIQSEITSANTDIRGRYLKLTSFATNKKPKDLVSFEIIPTEKFRMSKTFSFEHLKC